MILREILDGDDLDYHYFWCMPVMYEVLDVSSEQYGLFDFSLADRVLGVANRETLSPKHRSKNRKYLEAACMLAFERACGYTVWVAIDDKIIPLEIIEKRGNNFYTCFFGNFSMIDGRRNVPLTPEMLALAVTL